MGTQPTPTKMIFGYDVAAKISIFHDDKKTAIVTISGKIISPTLSNIQYVDTMLCCYHPALLETSHHRYTFLTRE